MAQTLSYFILTHSICLLIFIIGIIVSLAILPEAKLMFTFAKGYAVPIAVEMACVAFTLVVIAIGYLTIWVKNRTWVITYTVYFSFVVLFYICVVIVMHKRDTFLLNQVQLLVEYHNYEDNYSNPYLYFMQNLTCCYCTGCKGNDSCNITHTEGKEKCDIAAKNKFKKLLNTLLVVDYFELFTCALHLIELIIRAAFYSVDNVISDSAALSRFVQMT